MAHTHGKRIRPDQKIESLNGFQTILGNCAQQQGRYRINFEIGITEDEIQKISDYLFLSLNSEKFDLTEVVFPREGIHGFIDITVL